MFTTIRTWASSFKSWLVSWFYTPKEAEPQYRAIHDPIIDFEPIHLNSGGTSKALPPADRRGKFKWINPNHCSPRFGPSYYDKRL